MTPIVTMAPKAHPVSSSSLYSTRRGITDATLPADPTSGVPHRHQLRRWEFASSAGYARWVFRHLLVFALILVLLRRFTAIQVSILGSLALTVVVSLLISRLDRRGK